MSLFPQISRANCDIPNWVSWQSWHGHNKQNVQFLARWCAPNATNNYHFEHFGDSFNIGHLRVSHNIDANCYFPLPYQQISRLVNTQLKRHKHSWLVVYLPLWKIWRSVGIIIPKISHKNQVPNHQADNPIINPIINHHVRHHVRHH